MRGRSDAVMSWWATVADRLLAVAEFVVRRVQSAEAVEHEPEARRRIANAIRRKREALRGVR